MKLPPGETMVPGDVNTLSVDTELLNPNPKFSTENNMDSDLTLSNGEVTSHLEHATKVVAPDGQVVAGANGISEELSVDVSVDVDKNLVSNGAETTNNFVEKKSKDECAGAKKPVLNGLDKCCDVSVTNKENGEGCSEKKQGDIESNEVVITSKKSVENPEAEVGSARADGEDTHTLSIAVGDNLEVNLGQNSPEVPEVNELDEDEILGSKEGEEAENETFDNCASEEELLADATPADEANVENGEEELMEVDEIALEDIEFQDTEASEADRTGIFQGATMATLNVKLMGNKDDEVDEETEAMNIDETHGEVDSLTVEEASVETEASGVQVSTMEREVLELEGGSVEAEASTVEKTSTESEAMLSEEASEQTTHEKEIDQSEALDSTEAEELGTTESRASSAISMSNLQNNDVQVKMEPEEERSSVGVSINSMTCDMEIKTEVCDVGIGASEGAFIRTIKKETEVGKEAEKRSAEHLEKEATEEVKRARLEDSGTEEGGKNSVARDEVRQSLVDSEDEDADDPAPLADEPEIGKEADDKRTSETDTQKNLVESDDEIPEAASASISPCPSPCFSPTSILLPADVRAVKPALRNLRRGALAHLTRSDLEELMVQKLCEAMTERSPQTGELRRRVEALEQEVDKWKEKAVSYGKQCRELDLVLQKYLTETQRQANDSGGHIVTPIRVTRSVGLQVSIGVANKKNPAPSVKPVVKSVPILPSSPAGKKPEPVKLTLPLAARKVAVPAQRQTPASSPPKAPVIRPKPASKIFAPRAAGTPSAATPVVNPTAPKTPKVVRTIASPSSSRSVPAASSGVIDLTDDERPAAVTTPAGKKVVQATPQKLAYLLPTTQGGATKYLIATPPGHVPPPPQLVFKGGPYTRPAPTLRHPAPLPPTPQSQPYHPSWKTRPPRPALKISNTSSGIVLSWDMTLSAEHETISSYQLYAYQEGTAPPSPALWREVGDVKALPLPMACTLSCFVPGHRYHFSVRAVDVHMRVGPFSFPGSILLNK